jgi:vacuolar-type H+-ATPase subunit H
MSKAAILNQIREAEEKVEAVIKQAEETRRSLQAEGKRRALEKVEVAEASMMKDIDTRRASAGALIEARKNKALEEGRRRAEALESNAKRSAVKVKSYVLAEFERAADA